MKVTASLAAFAVGLLAVFGAAFGIGRAVGPIGDQEPAPGKVTTTMPGGMDMDHGSTP